MTVRLEKGSPDGFWKVVIVLFVLSLPLFIFGVKDQLVWDADWPQYIDQAQELLSGSVATDDVLNHLDFGPLFKGTGFSLLLAPIYKVFGLYVPPYLIVQLIFLIVGVIAFLAHIQKTNEQPRSKLLLVLIGLSVVYNYQIVRLKLEITPEFVYMGLLFSIGYIYEVRRSMWMAAILTGLAISVRDMGWSIYVSLIVIEGLKAYRNREIRWIEHLMLMMLPLLTWAAVESFVIGWDHLGHIAWYKPHFSTSGILDRISENLNVYAHQVLYLFEQEIWGWFNTGTAILAVITIPLGLILALRNGSRFLLVYFLIHMAVLLTYHYHKTSMRFLIPVVPILFYFMYLSLRAICAPFGWRRWVPETIFFLILISNYINTKEALTRTISASTRSQTAMEAWKSIEAITHRDDVIASVQPHALAVHVQTDRRCFALPPDQSIMTSKDLEPPYTHLLHLKADPITLSLDDDSRGYKLTTVWENEAFLLQKVSFDQNKKMP